MLNRRDFLIAAGIGAVGANHVAFGQGRDFVRAGSPEQTIYDSKVGRGIDTVLVDLKNDVFRPTIRQITFPAYGDTDFFNFELARSQTEFTTSTSRSASAKGSYGLGKAKASGRVKKLFNSNSYSCYLVGYFRKASNPYEAGEITVRPEILRFVRRHQNDPLKIERQLGDGVITGFNLAAELIVIAEFQTSSEDKKKEVAAKLSVTYGSGKGSAKFAEAVRSVQSSTRKTISVFGHIPDSKVDLTSEDELIGLVNNFNVDYLNKLKISSYITRPFRTLNSLLNSRDFVDDSNLRLRSEFAEHLNSLYQSYEDWFADISYVLDETKRDEFDQSVINKAREDKRICEEDLEKIEGLERASLRAWEKERDWQAFYNLKLLNSFLKEFPSYKQKQTPVQPGPKTRRPKRPIERGGGRNDLGIGRH